MIIESGLIVAIGLLLMFLKTSWKTRMRMLSYPLVMDVVIFVALTAIHWGTFSGVMTAAVGALVCSALLALGKFAFGCCERGKYTKGVWDVSAKL